MSWQEIQLELVEGMKKCEFWAARKFFPEESGLEKSLKRWLEMWMPKKIQVVSFSLTTFQFGKCSKRNILSRQ
jgi:hypothetical protein